MVGKTHDTFPALALNRRETMIHPKSAFLFARNDCLVIWNFLSQNSYMMFPHLVTPPQVSSHLHDRS